MKQKYSPEQIVRFLREAEGKLASDKTAEEVCRENARLTKPVADLSLDKAILNEALERKC